MKESTDVQVQRGHIRVNHPTLIVSVIGIISGVWLVAASYFTVISRLDHLSGSVVTPAQFNGWLDVFRSRNKTLDVPSLPAKEKEDRYSQTADVLFSETRISANHTPTIHEN